MLTDQFYGHSPLLLIQEGHLSVTDARWKHVHKCWITTLRTKPAQVKCEQVN